MASKVGNTAATGIASRLRKYTGRKRISRTHDCKDLLEKGMSLKTVGLELGRRYVGTNEGKNNTWQAGNTKRSTRASYKNAG